MGKTQQLALNAAAKGEITDPNLELFMVRTFLLLDNQLLPLPE